MGRKSKSKKLYDDYDYEEAYSQEIEKLSEKAMEEMLHSGKVSCLYRTLTTKAGQTLLADIYPSFRHQSDMPRGKRVKESTAAQKQLNTKRSVQELINRINANFGEGDLWMTLEYDPEHLPESLKDAQRILGNYIKKVNRKLKKMVKPKMKYICVTEYSDPVSGKTKRVHHHIVLSCDLHRDELEKMWLQGERTKSEYLHPTKESWLKGLGIYISKGNYRKKSGQRRWTCSKGLKKPDKTKSYCKFRKKDVRELVEDFEHARELMEKKYPGYRLVDLKQYWNDMNESWYIHAEMIAETWREAKKDGKVDRKYQRTERYPGRAEGSGKKAAKVPSGSKGS